MQPRPKNRARQTLQAVLLQYHRQVNAVGSSLILPFLRDPPPPSKMQTEVFKPSTAVREQGVPLPLVTPAPDLTRNGPKLGAKQRRPQPEPLYFYVQKATYLLDPLIAPTRFTLYHEKKPIRPTILLNLTNLAKSSNRTAGYPSAWSHGAHRSRTKPPGA